MRCHEERPRDDWRFEIRIRAVSVGDGHGLDALDVGRRAREWKSRRNRRRGYPLQSRPTTEFRHIVGHRLPLRASSMRCALLRHASARMVSVGFLSEFDANTPPSMTKRFLIAHD